MGAGGIVTGALIVAAGGLALAGAVTGIALARAAALGDTWPTPPPDHHTKDHHTKDHHHELD